MPEDPEGEGQGPLVGCFVKVPTRVFTKKKTAGYFDKIVYHSTSTGEVKAYFNDDGQVYNFTKSYIKSWKAWVVSKVLF